MPELKVSLTHHADAGLVVVAGGDLRGDFCFAKRSDGQRSRNETCLTWDCPMGMRGFMGCATRAASIRKNTMDSMAVNFKKTIILFL